MTNTFKLGHDDELRRTKKNPRIFGQNSSKVFDEGTS